MGFQPAHTRSLPYFKPTTRLMNDGIPIRTFTRAGRTHGPFSSRSAPIWSATTVGRVHRRRACLSPWVLTDRLGPSGRRFGPCSTCKAQKWVFQALLLRSCCRALCALHTDSGSEFINHHLHRYCGQQRIEFTRSRPNRKNDNNFTEQKNNDVVPATSATCV